MFFFCPSSKCRVNRLFFYHTAAEPAKVFGARVIILKEFSSATLPQYYWCDARERTLIQFPTNRVRSVCCHYRNPINVPILRLFGRPFGRPFRAVPEATRGLRLNRAIFLRAFSPETFEKVSKHTATDTYELRRIIALRINTKKKNEVSRVFHYNVRLVSE